MRFHDIKEVDIADGPGIRVSLFTQGCPFHCKGCFNEETWDFNSGKAFTKEDQAYILKLLENPYISGFSVLGGEPLVSVNIGILGGLLKEIKNKFPQKTIWVWSGNLYENLIKNEAVKNVLQYIDVLVEGPFEINKRDITESNLWRGSTNQRVVDVQESFKSDEEVLKEGIPNNV